MSNFQGDKKLFSELEVKGANFEYDQVTLSLKVLPSKLFGGEINVNKFNDAITILSILGCFSKGSTIITGATNTRFKECNRLAVMTKELSKLGANIHETNDGLIIHEGNLNYGKVHSHQDYRVVISLVVAGLGSNAGASITDVNCINKSYLALLNHFPNLARILNTLNIFSLL